MSKQLIVPFYLNENVINEIYAIMVEKYIKTKNSTRKKQCNINLKTPLSNILEGEYIQGDLSIQIYNEYSRERSDEKVSILIEMFSNVLDTLKNEKMIRYINNKDSLNNLQNREYILVNSKLQKSPITSQIENMINIMEVQEIFKTKSESHEEKIIKSLKENYNNLKKNKYIKYLSENLYGTNYKFIFPLKNKFMLEDIDYFMCGDFSIFAKVINFCDKLEEKEKVLKMGDCFDYLEQGVTNSPYKSFVENISKTHMEYINKYTFIETIPIAIYV